MSDKITPDCKGTLCTTVLVCWGLVALVSLYSLLSI